MISIAEYQEVKALYTGMMIAFFASLFISQITGCTLIASTIIAILGIIFLVLLFITIHKEHQDYGRFITQKPSLKKETSEDPEPDLEQSSTHPDD